MAFRVWFASPAQGHHSFPFLPSSSTSLSGGRPRVTRASPLKLIPPPPVTPAWAQSTRIVDEPSSGRSLPPLRAEAPPTKGSPWTPKPSHFESTEDATTTAGGRVLDAGVQERLDAADGVRGAPTAAATPTAVNGAAWPWSFPDSMSPETPPPLPPPSSTPEAHDALTAAVGHYDVDGMPPPEEGAAVVGEPAGDAYPLGVAAASTSPSLLPHLGPSSVFAYGPYDTAFSYDGGAFSGTRPALQVRVGDVHRGGVSYGTPPLTVEEVKSLPPGAPAMPLLGEAPPETTVPAPLPATVQSEAELDGAPVDHHNETGFSMLPEDVELLAYWDPDELYNSLHDTAQATFYGDSFTSDPADLPGTRPRG